MTDSFHHGHWIGTTTRDKQCHNREYNKIQTNEDSVYLEQEIKYTLF